MFHGSMKNNIYGDMADGIPMVDVVLPDGWLILSRNYTTIMTKTQNILRNIILRIKPDLLITHLLSMQGKDVEYNSNINHD